MTAAEVDALGIVLTARCNLRCTYCYQNDPKPRSMSWDTLRGALDLLLSSRRKRLELLFLGGEPLLEFPLIQRAVDYVRAARPAGKRVRYTIITNGTILRRKHARFLDRHRIRVQLSFDGVPAAQDLRGRGTFEVLDSLLDRLRVEQPRLFREGLCVSLTLTSASLPYLADSIEYFLRKGIPEIALSPVVTHDPGWRRESIDVLDSQLARVFDACLRQHRRCNEVPLLLFRQDGTARDHRRPLGAMCRAPTGRTLAVDVDGQVHGCAAFVESYQKLTSPFLRRCVDTIRLGDFRDPRLAERLERYPQATRETRIFHDKRDKYSSFGRCAECRFLRACSICPVSIAHIPGNVDPRRVPDFPCAFNRVALSYRERFAVRRNALSQADWRRLEALAAGAVPEGVEAAAKEPRRRSVPEASRRGGVHAPLPCSPSDAPRSRWRE